MCLSSNKQKRYEDDNKDISNDYHPLSRQWTLWTHLPHDTDWTINSYKQVYEMTSVEETIALTETLPEVLVTNCMLFIMRNGVVPVWRILLIEQGGCFHIKFLISKTLYSIWKELTYMLVGETISENKQFVETVTGITISPKKSFCIIKIWLSTCNFRKILLLLQTL